MSTERVDLAREALREREAPGDLLRRYLAAGGLQAIGYVVLALGLLALIIGWFGVSREAIVAKQIPYLVSGGLGGAFLLGIGALLLIVHELRLDNRRLESLEMLVEELRDALLVDEEPTTTRSIDVDLAAPTAPSIPNGAPPAPFAVVGGGTRYHVPTCPSTAGKETSAVSEDDVRDRALTPCRLCAPDTAAAAV